MSVVSLEVCQCPNGIGKLACQNDTRYDCETCNLGYMKVEQVQSEEDGEEGSSDVDKVGSICVETCLEGEKLDNSSNRCVSTECYITLKK